MKRIRKAVFPVAGLGTRFLPATKSVPKEMLTVVDKPVIQHVVEEAAEAGIEHFIFVTGRNKDVIEDHFDVAYELDATLESRGKTGITAGSSVVTPPASTGVGVSGGASGPTSQPAQPSIDTNRAQQPGVGVNSGAGVGR